MSKERMERFERIWSIQHAVPVESLPEQRWITQDGYRDPAMAAHYRTFNLALDSIIIALPQIVGYEAGYDSFRENEFASQSGELADADEVFALNRSIEVREAIEAAGVKIA